MALIWCATALAPHMAGELLSATVHVATVGNDQNAGTQAAPVATLRNVPDDQRREAGESGPRQ